MKMSSITSRYTRNELLISILVIIIYAVGVAGIVIPLSRHLFIRLIPAVILLSLAAMLSFQRIDKKTFIVFSAIIILSWMVEAAAVASGSIFGIYSYGPALGIQVLKTPLLIGFNWLLLVCGSAAITKNIKDAAVMIFSASALMVAYDLALEHVAPFLGMWEFEGGSAPFRNYIAWFLLALLFHTALKLAGIRISNRVPSVIFVVQLLFFLLLTILFRLS
jgi:putative membrane protein